MGERDSTFPVAGENGPLWPADRTLWGFGLVCLFLLTACVPPVPLPPQQETPPLQEKPAALPAAPPLTQGVADALLPPLSGEPAAANAPRFDISVNHASAREFFTSLVAGTSWNMVLHPDVKGEISLTLKNVTVAQAVETACEIYGFDCLFREGGFRVFPRQFVTRTYRVDFLPLIRSGVSSTVVSSGSSPANLEERGPTIREEREGIKAGDKGMVEKGRGVVSSTIDTTYHSDFWGELQSVLQAMLRLDRGTVTRDDKGGVTVVRQSDEENGRSVMVNRQAGLLMVRALPSELREVEGYLEQLRDRTFRQVILEAKVVEVELNDGFRFGIDWFAISQGLGKDLPPLQGEPGGGGAFLTLPMALEAPGHVAVGSAAKQYSYSAYPSRHATAILSKQLGGPFSFATRAHDFTAFISMLQSQGKVQVLSSPRVAAINNQKAVIKVGEDSSYITDVDYKVVTTPSGNVIETADPEFSSYFSGVSLDVTPQIGEEGMVTLHIHPIVADVRQHTLIVENRTYPLATSRTRETDNVIRARDGELVVIGGLMKRDQREAVEKIPLLGDIPVLGQLFSHTRQDTIKSELVILLRPMLVDQGWSGAVGQTSRRLQEMGVSPQENGLP